MGGHRHRNLFIDKVKFVLDFFFEIIEIMLVYAMLHWLYFKGFISKDLKTEKTTVILVSKSCDVSLQNLEQVALHKVYITIVFK